MNLDELSKTTRTGMVKMDRLHRRWWDSAMDAFNRNSGAVDEWKQGFMREMQDRAEQPGFSPTLKQWNLVKTIGETCR